MFHLVTLLTAPRTPALAAGLLQSTASLHPRLSHQPCLMAPSLSRVSPYALLTLFPEPGMPFSPTRRGASRAPLCPVTCPLSTHVRASVSVPAPSASREGTIPCSQGQGTHAPDAFSLFPPSTTPGESQALGVLSKHRNQCTHRLGCQKPL